MTRGVVLAGLCAGAVAQSGWRQVQPAHVPPARLSAFSAYDLNRGVVVLFGGQAAVPLADTWEWNGIDWAPRPTVNAPPARSNGAMAFDPLRGRVVLFGGVSSVALSDTWEYDGFNWIGLAATGPSQRHSAAMAYDFAGTRMILFGGAAGFIGFGFNDTWAWDGQSWRQLQPFTVPPGRYSHAMIGDIGGLRIMMQGGTASHVPQPLADTWYWEGGDWRRDGLVTHPGGNMQFGMAFDMARSLPVMFGGYPASSATMLLADGAWRLHVTAGPSPRFSTAFAFDPFRAEAVLFGGATFAAVPLGDTWIYHTPVLARWSSIGNGCVGSAGLPVLSRISTSPPVIGQSLVLAVSPVRDGPAAIVTGFSIQSWLGVPLPAAMDVVGMPGCTAYTSVDAVIMTTASRGRAYVTLAVPASPSLLGVAFANQAISWDPGANALGVVLSNAGVGVIGEA